MSEFVVSGLQFVEGGIEISFMRLPEDIRNDGKFIASRGFSVADDHPAYSEEIKEIRDLVIDLVSDLYEDFDTAPIAPTPTDDDEDDEDDEDKGMGE